MELPFIIKKVHGKAEQRGKPTRRPCIKGDINAAKRMAK